MARGLAPTRLSLVPSAKGTGFGPHPNPGCSHLETSNLVVPVGDPVLNQAPFTGAGFGSEGDVSAWGPPLRSPQQLSRLYSLRCHETPESHPGWSVL